MFLMWEVTVMSAYEIRSFPIIEDDGRSWYGGDQDWYPDRWQRMAGCASVAGANLAAFYDLCMPAAGHIYQKQEFLEIMQQVYRYMRPGANGFPHVQKFADQFCAFARDHGRDFAAAVARDWHDSDTPRELICRELQAQNPVALLVLRHLAPELEDNTWHWMTITGYEADTDRLVLSNCGLRESYPAEAVLAPDRRNEVRLAVFHEQQSEQGL